MMPEHAPNSEGNEIQFGSYHVRRESMSTSETIAIDKQMEHSIPVFTEILEICRERILAGEYQTIIGEDASGRIPAQIMHKTLREIYRALGYESPQIVFLAGTHRASLENQTANWETKLELVENILEQHRGRFAVVTDTIRTGENIGFLCEAMDRADAEYDIITTRLEGAKHIPHLVELSKGNSVNFYQYPEANGVKKDPNNVFAHRADTSNRNIMEYYRAKIKETAEVLAKQFLGEIGING